MPKHVGENFYSDFQVHLNITLFETTPKIKLSIICRHHYYDFKYSVKISRTREEDCCSGKKL